MQEIPYKVCLFMNPLFLDTCFLSVLAFMPISLFIIKSIKGEEKHTDLHNVQVHAQH